MNLPQLITAIDFAARKHRDQRRKNPESAPYINHCIEVTRILATEGMVEDFEVLVAAVLHDTIEDTETSEAELRENFGDRVTDLLMEVTDDKSLPKKTRKDMQIEHAAHSSHEACLIKLADKIANLRSLKESPPVGGLEERIHEYFNWAGEVVQSIRVKNPNFNGNAGLETALSQAELNERRS